MKSNYVFVVNELANLNVIRQFELEPSYMSIAECTGNLYNIRKNPTLIINDKIKRQINRRVFGVLYRFDGVPLQQILQTFDSYHCCSMSRIGISNPHDWNIRITNKAYPINFNSIEQFVNYRYEYEEPINCYMWVGNIECRFIKKAIKSSNKLIYGLYEKGLIDAIRKEITNEQNKFA